MLEKKVEFFKDLDVDAVRKAQKEFAKLSTEF